MGRQSADALAQINVRVPRGNQAYWEIIRELRTFTITDIEQRCNVLRNTIGDYVRRLARAGVIVAEGKRDKTIIYRLVTDQPDAPAVRRDGSLTMPQGLGQEQMWRTMKMLKTFDAAELAASASTDTVGVSLETAKTYVSHLLRAGYLIVVVPAKPGYKPGTGNPARYRLRPDMITGPLAPQIQRTDWVWDPNRKQVMGPEAKP